MIKIIHINRAHIAEQQDQDRQPDRRFGGGDGGDEKHENLAVDVAEVMRTR